MDVAAAVTMPASIDLEEPDLEDIKHSRLDRNRAAMKAVNSFVTSEIMPVVDKQSVEEKAAICIQAHYRGFLDRKKYLQALFCYFEQEEAMRLEKVMKQVEEGELLVENHRLEVQLDDNCTTRRNKSRQYLTHIITIQRAWRAYLQRQGCTEAQCSKNMSPQLSDGEDALSESTDSVNGTQNMSVSTCTPDDGPRPVNGEETLFSLHSALSKKKLADDQTSNHGIEPEPESFVSDYSEIAEPVKEHLANVQIIQKEDLETGNTMFPNQFVVQQKIARNVDESEEDYCKRLRKINYLSLAQEFAALKKIDADALPFDLHKGQSYPMDLSPLSDSNSEADPGSDLATPCEPCKDFPDALVKSSTTPTDKEKLNMHSVVSKLQDSAMSMSTSSELLASSSHSSMSDSLSSVDRVDPETISYNDQLSRLESKLANSMNVQNETNNAESSSKKPANPGQAPGEKTNEKLGDFDVFNIETTLPQVDWKQLEFQLQRAAEEEREKMKSRQTDREEIRRKLAMGIEEEYYCGERMYKKPNLQTRLQSGMNLQICFMNEAIPDSDGNISDPAVSPKPQAEPNKLQSTTPPPPVVPKTDKTTKPAEEENEDFFKKQQRLQAEATMALAQVRPMAHMQLEVEKQLRKKSPIAEMVGIPGFGTRQKMRHKLLQEMNLAQLQVVVNDLHSQIENLNEELVKLLIQRDDSHMEQDSMLVDIDDLSSRRAQEVAAKNREAKEKKEEMKADKRIMRRK